MKRISILLSTFLTWAAFETGLFRRRKDSYDASAIELALAPEEEKRQQKKLRVSNVIPHWIRKRRPKFRHKLNYFSTKSRDVRDSDQQKIRRKINNM